MDSAEQPRLSRADFELLEMVGEGSYGKVFRARWKSTGQIVAIKVITLDDAPWMDLIREINICMPLRHEAIVNYYGWFFDERKRLWIIMEFCNGGSLSDVMDVLGHPLNEMQLSAVCHGVLESLAYVHSLNMIHRDIKAANLLVTTDGKVKLCDFGVSTQLEKASDQALTMTGSPYWMAPEVITGTGQTTKVDIWSFGITAIELYDGRPPRSDMSTLQLIQVIPKDPPPEPPGKASYLFRNFVQHVLVKDPALRPNASELLNDPFILKCGDHGAQMVSELANEFVTALKQVKKGKEAPIPAEFLDGAKDVPKGRVQAVRPDIADDDEEEEEEVYEDGTFVRLSPNDQATILMGGGTFIQSGTVVASGSGGDNTGLSGWNMNVVLGARPAQSQVQAAPARRFRNFGATDLKYMLTSLKQLAEKELAEGKNRQTVLSYYNEVRSAIIDEMRRKGMEVEDSYEAIQ